jgi:hypothetical protein
MISGEVKYVNPDGTLTLRGIQELQRIDKKAGSGGGAVAWADVTGKPSTFAPSAHTHVIADVMGLQAALDSKQNHLLVPFHTDATANVTLTNQANSAQFLANSNRNITRVDLTGYTQARLVCRVVTGSASVNNPRIYARYRTAFSTTATDYLLMGTSEIECSLSATGVIDSGWIDLVAGAQADVFLTVIQNGGDGAADPALGMVTIRFK